MKDYKPLSHPLHHHDKGNHHRQPSSELTGPSTTSSSSTFSLTNDDLIIEMLIFGRKPYYIQQKMKLKPKCDIV